MKGFTIVPYAGLANRMRAISSGIYIAKEYSQPATVYWFKEKLCFADFTDLFEPIQIENVSMKKLASSNLFLIPAAKRNFFIPSFLRKFYYQKQISNFNRISGNIFDQLDSSFDKIYLSSCHSMSSHYPLQSLFKPVADIREKIETVKRLFSKQTIGIHIRRTDNVHSIKSASIDDFKYRIESEISKDPDVKFYLATDDSIVKEQLIQQFKNRIICYEASLTRGSVDGMKDAVVDLWCLSQTSRIIGSYFSSYSEIAAELGNISIEFMKK